MKNFKSLLIGTVIGLSGLNAYSQAPSYPAASPAASVSQTFGITKIDINYSSPGVKGRTIWGNVVPYDSVWRTGANKCTDITFSTDVMINGQKVKKGKYALFTIPGRNSWTVVLNSDAEQWGAYGYKKSMDVARFMVTPQMADMKERMTFMIDAASDSTGVVTLRWEKMKIDFMVMADTKVMVEKGIMNFADNNSRNYASAANYNVDNGLDLAKANDWAKMAVTMTSNYYNNFIMARVLHAQGNDKEALKYANESKKIGDMLKDDEGYQNTKPRIDKLIAELNASAPASDKKKKK